MQAPSQKAAANLFKIKISIYIKNHPKNIKVKLYSYFESQETYIKPTQC